MIIAFICGLAVSLGGTYLLERIPNRKASYTLPALILFLWTQVLGYVVAGEPAGTFFFGGWVLGLFPYIIWRLWSDYKRDRKRG